MSDVQERLNALAGRGTARGADAVLDAAARAAQHLTDEEADDEARDTLPMVSAEPTRRPRRPLSSLIAATGVTVLLLVSMLAVSAFLGNGGASSPEGAVRRLAEAISHEDPLAAADVLSPSEVRTLHGTLDAASKRAQELTLVNQAGAPLAGVDFNVDDLQLDVQPLGDGFAKVRIRGGTIRARQQHGKFSPLLQKSVAPSNGQAEYDFGEGWGDENAREIFVMAVRDGDNWYVSAAYTTLEYYREYNGLPPAEYGAGLRELAKLGAETPDAAVQEGLRALADNDWSKLVSLADPKELPVYDYRAAILEGATRAETQSNFDIRQLTTSSTISGSTAKVRITASGTTDDGDWSLDGGCYTGPPQEVYLESGQTSHERPEFCVGRAWGGFLGGSLLGLSPGSDQAGPSEITAVQRDGRWFVSPVATALELLDTWIQAMNQRTLYTLLGQPERLPLDGRITLNEPVTLPAPSGGINAAVYELDGRAGQEVLAELTPHETDCCGYTVVLVDANGNYVSDGVIPLNGNSVRLPADGKYRVVVVVYRPGKLTLTLWEKDRAPAAVREENGERCQYVGGNGTSCSMTDSGSVGESLTGSGESSAGALAPITAP